MNNNKKTKKQLIEKLEILQNELDLLKNSTGKTQFSEGLPTNNAVSGSNQSLGDFAEIAEGIFNCIPANIALVDESGKIIAVNRAWKKFAEDNNASVHSYFIGANYLEACECSKGNDEDTAKSAAEGIKDVLKGKSSEFSLEYPCPSEYEKRWFRLFVTPLALRGERCAVVMHINISETISTKEALGESELRYRTIINNASDAIFISDLKGKLFEVNDEACMRLGYSREELLKMTPREFSSSENSILLEERIKTIIQKKHAVYETIHLKCDGTPIPTEINANLIDYNGHPAFIAIGRDITLRKRNEELLIQINEENNAQRKALLNAIPDMIFLLSSEGVFLDSYIPERSTSEFPEGDLKGKNLRDILPQLITEETKSSLEEVLKDGKMFVLEFPLVLGKEQNYYEARVVKCGEDRILAVVRNITGKKKDEEEIHKLSLAIEQSPVIVLITDKKGNIEYVNPRFTEVTGYTFEEAFGMNPRMLKSDYTPKAEYQKLWSNIKAGQHWKGEFRNRKKNGELFWELSSIFPLKNSLGEVTQFVAVKEDITEKKAAEELLKESEESYRSLFEDISAIMLLVDQSNGAIVKASNGASKFYGYDKDSLLKMNLSQISNASFEETDKFSNNAFPESGDKHYFHKHRLANGAMKDVEIHRSMIRLKGQTYIYLIIEDITERREAELRLAEYQDHLEHLVEERTDSLKKVNQLLSIEIEKQKASEVEIQNQLQFLRTLINTIPNPIVIKDNIGRLIDCNKTYEKYFNLTLDEIRNKRVNDIVPEFILDKVLETEASLLANPGHIAIELSHFREDGQPFSLVVSESTYMRSDNTIGGTVAIMIDITEQKKLQGKIEAALQKEQELNELKTSFISMASHEFRTPLTSILASADLLEMFGRQWKEEKYQEHIGKIQKAVDYMKELLDDVLIISRNEEGKTQFVPAKINFFELCSELFYDSKAASPGIHSFIFNYMPEQKLFFLDPKLLRHITSNLLSNAVKYSPEGGKIIFTVRVENNTVMMEISDEGIGIPLKDRNKLFEPFYRAGNTNTIHGTGLGMSIVKRSVDLHGGQISIDSEENKGTTVRVLFPLN